MRAEIFVYSGFAGEGVIREGRWNIIWHSVSKPDQHATEAQQNTPTQFSPGSAMPTAAIHDVLYTGGDGGIVNCSTVAGKVFTATLNKEEVYMINQYEVPACIEDALPELRRPLHQFPAVYHIYETVTCFKDYMIRQLQDHNFSTLARCLQVAGRLYERGNPVVRGAVAEIVVSALSRVPLADKATRIHLYSLIPASFYPLYMQQHLGINTSNK